MFKNRIIISIITISFFASLLYSFAYRIHPVVDAKAYDRIALNIISGNGFREQGSDVPILFDRSIQRAGPAYEYFLAGLYWMFGHHLEAVWIAQALLHALSAGLLWCIAKRLFEDWGDQIGAIAAAIFGLHPDLIEISAMLMTETLYLFFIALTIYLFVRVYERPHAHHYAILLGGTLALGVLSRPTVLLFLPVIAAYYLARRAFIPLLLCIVIFAALLSPWSFRNYRVYSQWIPTTLIGEYNIWIGNMLSADGGQLSGGHNPWDAYAASYGYGSIKQKAREEFRNFIDVHPLRFAELTAIRTIRYISLIRPMGFWFYQTGLPQLLFAASSGLAIAVLFVSGAAGIFLLVQQKKPLYYYMMVLAFTAPLPLIITVVQSRYRFQIYPFLALFSGYFIAYAWTHTGWWKQKSFLIPTGILLGATLIDLGMNIEKIMERIHVL